MSTPKYEQYPQHYSFKAFIDFDFDNKPIKEALKEKQDFAEGWLKHFNSIAKEDLYQLIFIYSDYKVHLEKELYKAASLDGTKVELENTKVELDKTKVELENTKKQLNTNYMLLFMVFILGCIIGKIQGKIF